MNRRDNWRNVLYIAGDWSAVIFAAIVTAVSGYNVGVYIAAVVIIGSRQRALMNLVHESAHRKLFANRQLNDQIGRLFVAHPILLSLSSYQRTHRRHHAFLWDHSRDPDAGDYDRFGLSRPPWPGRARFLVQHLLVNPFLIYPIYAIRGILTQRNENKREMIGRALYVVAVVIIFLLEHHLKLLVLFWIVPYVTGLMFIWYIAFMGEHAGLEGTDAFQITRNWTGNVLTRWLVGSHSDDRYHLVHHLYPMIPHYRLRAAHELLLQKSWEYGDAHQCVGFFISGRGSRSVIADIMAVC